jgi:hypothetical protein
MVVVAVGAVGGVEYAREPRRELARRRGRVRGVKEARSVDVAVRSRRLAR